MGVEGEGARPDEIPDVASRLSGERGCADSPVQANIPTVGAAKGTSNRHHVSKPAPFDAVAHRGVGL